MKGYQELQLGPIGVSGLAGLEVGSGVARQAQSPVGRCPIDQVTFMSHLLGSSFGFQSVSLHLFWGKSGQRSL